MVDVVNKERAEHIMTVEDPIEFLHTHKTCIVNQREIGADTHGFGQALKHVLRQDPDVILVGEMRDLETIETAITAAETGHLVFATLHTQDAPQTIDRIIDVSRRTSSSRCGSAVDHAAGRRPAAVPTPTVRPRRRGE
jgi:twitching motility protein PilT